MFTESTEARCTPDAIETSSGGQWQGFALAAGRMNFQFNGDGLLYQIRDVAPDPDAVAPSITGGILGDSHALTRTITATIADTGSFATGLDVSPVPGQGPTVVATITSEDGTVTTTSIAMTTDGNRNNCVETACEWTADIDNLARGDSVSYTITAQDLWPPGANLDYLAAYSFDVATPTNTLVVEWVEYREESYTDADDGCSMQVIMYDVTNEFEFHYEDDCDTDENLGLIGIRESQSNFLEVANNDDFFNFGNPHDNNWRFTLSPSGDYIVEPFARGMNPLPLDSSTQAISVSATDFSSNTRCDEGSATSGDFANYLPYCAKNFDIPDDFNFEFYGQSYDGTNPDNRMQVLATGFLHFIDDGDTVEKRIEAKSTSASTCFPSDGTSPANFWTNCGGGYNILQGTLPAMAPYWSRQIIDWCGDTQGETNCQGVWYRTIPFDGAGKTISADITEDTTFYLLDSPIKIDPTDSSGYLSITADLTIEAGVEVIVAENKGISFDGGVSRWNLCTVHNTGTTTDRVTFTADTTFNANALWDGLAFTSDCGSNSMTDRHVITSTDFSNTNYAAITAGSRGEGTLLIQSVEQHSKTVMLVNSQWMM